MFVRAYHKLKEKLDRVKDRQASNSGNKFVLGLQHVFYRIIIQIIVLPHFLMLGPFKTFTTFARTDDQGSWVDSYNDFIVNNRITARGIIAVILIGLLAIFIFIYLPIFYI